MPAVCYMVQHRPKDGAILRVICLGDEGAAQVEAHPPKGQHQPQPVLTVLLHWKAPAQPTGSSSSGHCIGQDLTDLHLAIRVYMYTTCRFVIMCSIVASAKLWLCCIVSAVPPPLHLCLHQCTYTEYSDHGP